MRIEDLESIIDKQSEDEWLWFTTMTGPEFYLQQELRKLHIAVREYIADARKEQGR